MLEKFKDKSTTVSNIESEIERILEENHRRTLITIGVIGFAATVLYFALLYHLWHIQIDFTRTKNYAIEHLRPEYGQIAIEEVS